MVRCVPCVTVTAMSIGLTEERSELAATVRRWCEETVSATERRRGLDEPAPVRPAFWDAMVAMGWPMLHVGEDAGGQGGSLADLAVVLEATGQAGIPGPLLPTALCAAVLDRAAPPDLRAELLPYLAEGTTGAVAFASAPLRAAEDHDELVVEGTLDSVLGAAGASLLVAPIEVGGDLRWVVLDEETMEVAEPTGVDPCRPVSSVTVSQRRVARHWVLDGPSSAVPDLAALLLSAEAVGLAAWCVDTAADHARNRVQFGRPIGQFQGVKHRCADMLAALELSRAAVWDACRGGTPDEERLAISCVGSIVPDLVVGIAKDCIQVLGGMGFTWEHDAHVYLRRALATRSLLPAPSTDRAEVVRLVRQGVVRSLPVDLPAEAETARAEVRAWLEDLTDRPREEWNAAIADAGYIAPHWPPPWGRGAGAVEQVVIDQEFRAARVRRPHLQVAAWALPTLIEHGTAEQQQRWVGPSMRQEIQWCQLFSEPEAGSDLASLRMKAVSDDGGWRLTGQKVWTSMAHTADWGICLARTSPDKPIHDGITCFFVDMRSTGIDIRPLREINGDAWFNEVFFDDVFVPDDCVIGAVDDGWRAGRTTLANERVSMGSGASIGAGVSALVDLLSDDATPHDVDRVGHLVARDAALTALRQRMTLRALAGADAGPEASVVKLLGVIHDQDVQEAGLEVLGPAAAAATGEAAGWVSSFLWNRNLTIAGGTSEIQRNVIGERLLGLPRDA